MKRAVILLALTVRLLAGQNKPPQPKPAQATTTGRFQLTWTSAGTDINNPNNPKLFRIDTETGHVWMLDWAGKPGIGSSAPFWSGVFESFADAERAMDEATKPTTLPPSRK